jgi:hypothetical protein
VFHVREVQFGGDAANRNPADYDLGSGASAGSLTIIKAGDKIVEQLKSEGRPLAKLTTRKVVADHRTDTVDVVLAAEGGPVAPIGTVGVTGAKAVRSDFIERYSRINKGDRYSPEALKKAGERLRALGGQAALFRRRRAVFDDRRFRRQWLLGPPQSLRRRGRAARRGRRRPSRGCDGSGRSRFLGGHHLHQARRLRAIRDADRQHSCQDRKSRCL